MLNHLFWYHLGGKTYNSKEENQELRAHTYTPNEMGSGHIGESSYHVSFIQPNHYLPQYRFSFDFHFCPILLYKQV